MWCISGLGCNYKGTEALKKASMASHFFWDHVPGRNREEAGPLAGRPRPFYSAGAWERGAARLAVHLRALLRAARRNLSLSGPRLSHHPRLQPLAQACTAAPLQLRAARCAAWWVSASVAALMLVHGCSLALGARCAAWTAGKPSAFACWPAVRPVRPVCRLRPSGSRHISSLMSCPHGLLPWRSLQLLGSSRQHARRQTWRTS